MISLRPILISEQVSAADGKSYQVFVDVDDAVLRRVMAALVPSPLAVTQGIAVSILMEAFTLRLREQP